MIEENQEKIVTDNFFIYLKIIFIVCKRNCEYNEDKRKGKVCVLEEVKA
ncbi:MAG: hypothetical protein HDR20_07390 [Lachnospiraceae bacterium]|nr:hypothetical protein [Lachnospiraceae bacterium]